jgi:ribosome-binding factor A
MSKIRQRRTAEQIRYILSELFLRQMHDPRLQGLTITDVKIDRELQYANIYVNALGNESRQQEVMTSLDKAVGFLRRELSGRMRVRTVPQLQFHWDPTLAHAEEINQLLDSLDIPPEAANSSEDAED